MSSNSNYPPGVSGNEVEISGNREWEEWADSDRCKIGGRCRVVESGKVGEVFAFYDWGVGVQIDDGEVEVYQLEELGEGE